MNKQTENELKEKLAKWAGFTKATLKVPLSELSEIEREIWESIWIYPNEAEVDLLHSALPDFTQSLDACFKHLVPKALEIIGEQAFEGKLIWARCELMTKWLHGWNDNPDHPALALCLAIEKLKDSELLKEEK